MTPLSARTHTATSPRPFGAYLKVLSIVQRNLCTIADGVFPEKIDHTLLVSGGNSLQPYVGIFADEIRFLFEEYVKMMSPDESYINSCLEEFVNMFYEFRNELQRNNDQFIVFFLRKFSQRLDDEEFDIFKYFGNNAQTFRGVDLVEEPIPTRKGTEYEQPTSLPVVPEAQPSASPAVPQTVFDGTTEAEQAAERERQQAFVAELEAKGAHFDVIPEELPPGTPYTTPLELSRSGITKYSRNALLQFAREGVVPAYKLAGQTVFDAIGVEKILQLQRQREQQTGRGGSKPGRRRA